MFGKGDYYSVKSVFYFFDCALHNWFLICCEDEEDEDAENCEGEEGFLFVQSHFNLYILVHIFL